MNPLRPRFRLTGGSVALTLSVICHLALALLATRHFRMTSIAPELRSAPIELLAADFEVSTEADETPAAPARTEVPAIAPRAALQRPFAHNASTSPTPARAETAAAEPVPQAVGLDTAPENAGPHFKIILAATVGSASTKVAGSTLASPGNGLTSEPISPASADVPAKLRAGNVPAYTAAALAAGIEANVPLEIVVSESGVVTSVRGLEHVGYGLDEVARQSVLGYRFTPASRRGRAVAVRMRWLMRFQLR